MMRIKTPERTPIVRRPKFTLIPQREMLPRWTKIKTARNTTRNRNREMKKWSKTILHATSKSKCISTSQRRNMHFVDQTNQEPQEQQNSRSVKNIVIVPERGHRRDYRPVGRRASACSVGKEGSAAGEPSPLPKPPKPRKTHNHHPSLPPLIPLSLASRRVIGVNVSGRNS